MLKHLSILALAAVMAMPAEAALRLTLFDSGFTAPLFATGRGNSLYVVEQGGRIVEVNRSSKARSTFFTVPDIASGGENGLLGLAFDPRYKTNGRFYVNVTSTVNGAPVSEIRRYTNPAIASEASHVVMRVDRPSTIHAGGWIGFGADNQLYVAFGDGGPGNDPSNSAQNLDSMLGKILRLDVSRDGFPADPLRNYAIPVDNPFGTEIYAYGLRNPYRSSIDSMTGDIWIGDVGQTLFEEVNVIRAGTSGQNFGWRPLEGTVPTPGVGDAIPAGTVAPLTGYTHDNGDRSITGGYVYRGGRAEEIDGQYVFGDFISGRLWSVGLDGSGMSELGGLAASVGGANWSSFGEDGNRNLYAVDYGGRVFRIDGTRGPLAAPGVPEPGSWALLIAGFGLTGAMLRRRRLEPWAPDPV